MSSIFTRCFGEIFSGVIVDNIGYKSANPFGDRYNFRGYAVGVKIGVYRVALAGLEVFYDGCIVR